MLFVAVLGAFIGCTTDKKRKWLTLFFDGVPPEGAVTNAPAVEYDENGKPLDKKVVVSAAQPAAPKPKFVAHPPYEDKKCNECHESRFSVKMKGPQDKVCFSCHDDFLTKFKVKHQPAENGECSSCHDPHGNANPKMVLQTGSALCATCHDPFPKVAKSNTSRHKTANALAAIIRMRRTSRGCWSNRMANCASIATTTSRRGTRPQK